MPYITNDRREELEPSLAGIELTTPGELNYAITTICQAFLKKYGMRYHHLNDVVGALECAKMEFYRRLAVPYENEKIAENGDVMLIDGLKVPAGCKPI